MNFGKRSAVMSAAMTLFGAALTVYALPDLSLPAAAQPAAAVSTTAVAADGGTDPDKAGSYICRWRG